MSAPVLVYTSFIVRSIRRLFPEELKLVLHSSKSVPLSEVFKTFTTDEEAGIVGASTENNTYLDFSYLLQYHYTVRAPKSTALNPSSETPILLLKTKSCTWQVSPETAPKYNKTFMAAQKFRTYFTPLL